MTNLHVHTILQRIVKREERAFKELYTLYSKKIYAQCLRVLHTDTMAEEAVQEIFLKLWLMENQLLKIQNLDSYLKTVTRHHCLNKIRRVVLEQKSTSFLTENYEESHDETTEIILLKDTREFIDSVIQKLPDQQRVVYQLCHQEGLKYEEAAERLNISVNTVKTHMKRALATIREQLGKEFPIILLILLKLI